MTNAQCVAWRHSLFASRRALLASALALVTYGSGTPASDAAKNHKKRKPQRKKTCGKAGGSPIKGRCCAGAVVVDGVCQACRVCPSGCAFATVQGALDAASDGDTIAVCPGSYAGNLTITRNVRLIGGVDEAGASTTTLQGAKPAPVVTVKPARVALHHLRITGGHGEGGGIANLGGTLQVFDCLVSGNSDLIASGGGIYNAGHLVLTGSTVSQNDAPLGGGIFNAGGNAELQLVNSQVRGNSAESGGGIYTQEGADVLVDASSRVTANTARLAGGGIFTTPTAGRVTLASRENVTANAPTNCGGAAVDLCSSTGSAR